MGGYLIGMRLTETLHHEVESQDANSDCFRAANVQTERERPDFDQLSDGNSSSAQLTSISSDMVPIKGKVEHHPHVSRKELSVRDCFESPPQDSVLKERVMLLMADVMDTFNFKLIGCCHCHANLDVLSTWLHEMRIANVCGKPWTHSDAEWQCNVCKAVISTDQSETHCWICESQQLPQGIG